MLYKSIPLFRSALLDIDKNWTYDEIVKYTADVKKWGESYAVTTKITLFSNLRKRIEAVFGKNSDEYRHMRLLAMTEEERKTRDRITAENLVNANSNLIILKVSDFNNLIDKIGELPSLVRDILYCCMLSGARTIEIISDKFKFEKSNKDGYIVQIGASKTKNEIKIDKPLFTTYKSFNTRLQRVRGAVDQSLSNIELNQKYGKILVNGIKKLDIDYIKKPHDLRRVYAAIAYYRFGKYKKSQQQYYSEILGHSTTGSAQHYTQFVFRG